MMIRYELKKVFARTGSKIALLLLAIVWCIACRFATDVYWVNENGIEERGYAAVSRLRDAQREWAGVLDEERLRQVIEENRRINQTPQAKSSDVRESNIAYGWKQGIDGIRTLLNCAYEERFRSYDYYRADSLRPEDASEFYENRVRLLKEWLAGEGGDSDAMYRLSDAEKEYLIERYETLETPFYYDYMKGWVQLFEYISMIIMIAMLILGYLVAGIFSNEFSWKADAIFFSSVHGRGRAVAAKLEAGFLIVTALYWTAVLSFSVAVLGYLGISGWNCPVQADFSGWKCFYGIQVWQEYLLVIGGGYIGCLLIGFMTMYVSARFKSAVLGVMTPFVWIFLPSFLGNLNSAAANKVLGLLPDRLLQIHVALKSFDLYELGGKVVGAVPILFVVYSVLTVVLMPLLYEEYRRKQAG